MCRTSRHNIHRNEFLNTKRDINETDEEAIVTHTCRTTRIARRLYHPGSFCITHDIRSEHTRNVK